MQLAVERSSSRSAWPPLLHQVARTIRSRKLFQPGQHLLVAISGGPDSVALLSLLDRLRVRWRLTLTAVHCNYGLRGRESEGDQAFVAAFCQERGVPLHIRKLSLEAPSQRSSLQARARELRYDVMTEIAIACGADRIAVGHTADDQAETVLLWILRGAGLTGLSGMPAFRDGFVIRPLYDTRRRDILTYLQDAGLAFREDSSNAQPTYLRNCIRQEVVPVLNRLIPSSVTALCRLADICREDDRYLSEYTTALSASIGTHDTVGGWTIDRKALMAFPIAIQRRILRRMLQQQTPHHRPDSIRKIDRIIHLAAKCRGRSSIDMKQGRVLVGHAHVRFVRHQAMATPDSHEEQNPSRRLLKIPGQIQWPGTGQRLRVEECLPEQSPTHLGKHRIVVDADQLSQPLTVRSWEPGDRFHPVGMKGHSKKLQDFFTDLKVPIARRPFIPLVVAPEGIVWIVGYRQDHRWAPTRATRRYLLLTTDNGNSEEGTE